MSPARTGIGLVTRQPLSRVPFVEPRSASSQPPAARSRLACQRDTVSSASLMSQSASRPMVNRGCEPAGRVSTGGQPRSQRSVAWMARRQAASATARNRRELGRSATSPRSSPLVRARSAPSTRCASVSWLSRPAANPSPSAASACSRSASDGRPPSGPCGLLPWRATTSGLSVPQRAADKVSPAQNRRAVLAKRRPARHL
jgi:hypothetical protein